MSGQDLIVMPAGKLPSIPVVLLDSKFTTALTELENSAKAIVISDKAGADAAGALLVRAQNADKALEDARQKVKRPFLEIGKAIDAAAKNESNRILKIKATIKSRIMDWNAKEQARLRAEEEARQAEVRRLQQIQEEARKRAEEEAAKAAGPTIEIDLEIDDLPKTEIEKKIEDLQFGQKVATAAAPAGVHFRTNLVWTVEDINKVPDAFVTRQENRSAINRTFCVGWKDGDPVPQVPGLRFEINRQPIARATNEDELVF